MDSRRIVTGIVGLSLLSLVSAGVGRAQQPGVAERVGETLDNVGRGLVRGAQDVTETVRKRFDTVRSDVGRMGIQPRVYARLHWDKTLNSTRVEVHMLRDGVVLLRGVVPDAAAKARAVELARDTVEVTGVVDELEVLVPSATPTSRVAPTLSVPALSRPTR
jgi:osmotically-inducible protein OsmY